MKQMYRKRIDTTEVQNKSRDGYHNNIIVPGLDKHNIIIVRITEPHISLGICPV